MIYPVRLAPRAQDDLVRLAEFLAEVSPETALRAIDTIETAVASLKQFPERNRLHGEFRELVIPFGRSAYIARYEVRATEVVVGRIYHGREDR